MRLRCSKLVYFIMGLCNWAVSHWAAKDASLSLQGHMSWPPSGWDMDRIRASSGQKLTDYFFLLTSQSDRCPSVLTESWVCSILYSWHTLSNAPLFHLQMLTCTHVHAFRIWFNLIKTRFNYRQVLQPIKTFHTSIQSSFNHSDHLKLHCFNFLQSVWS